jgi:uncharacterized membrane protein
MIRLHRQSAPGDFTRPVLVAEIAPNFSVDRRIVAWSLALFATACLTVGALFWWRGAGPVMGFMGLEIVLLGGAFWLSFRDAGRREALSLAGEHTTVTARHGSRTARTTTLQTYWLDVVLDAPREAAGRLVLRSRGTAVELGSFLSAHERRELADAIRDAIAGLKSGPRAHPAG